MICEVGFEVGKTKKALSQLNHEIQMEKRISYFSLKQ